MNSFLFAGKFLAYLLRAKTRHSVHSPFVFRLLEDVILDKNSFYAFKEIRDFREQLGRSEEWIETQDYGTGRSGKKKLSSLLKKSGCREKSGQLLFRLVNYFKPQNILELGTSLGISGIYLAAPNKMGQVISLEGCMETASRARKNFVDFGISNVEVITGEIEKTLPAVLEKMKKIDFAFFDANHRLEPVMNYYRLCKPYFHPQSVLIIDDIHWSADMELAWKLLKSNPEISLSIDLFFLGILFFKEDRAKEEFVIRYF